ncbi:MAG: hypothetical protein AAF125_25890, partial [Chloroflexota bacterium]
FIPDVLTNEMMWIGVTTFVLTVMATWFFKAPLESHADPQQTPLHTLAPWYFLWIQGALKLGSKVFWGLVFPGLVFGFLAVMPYLDATPSRRYADRRFALTVSYVLLASLMIFTYWGLPTVGVATSPDIEILSEMIPEEHAGVLRPIPFDQLQPGAYTTAQFHGDNPAAAVAAFNAELAHEYEREVISDIGEVSMALTSDSAELSGLLAYNNQGIAPSETVNFVPVPSTSPQLEHAVAELEHLLEHHHMDNSWGAVIISPSQETLMRADVVIFWDAVDAETGEVVRSMNHSKTYLHENSEWFER